MFTSLTKQAMPVIRYRTRDLTRLLPGTARTMRRMEKITGRTDDMIILRGVNLFPTQIEEIVLGLPALSPHFQCHLDRSGNLDTLTVRVERREHTTAGRGGRGRGRARPADQGVDRCERDGGRGRRGLDRALGRARCAASSTTARRAESRRTFTDNHRAGATVVAAFQTPCRRDHPRSTGHRAPDARSTPPRRGVRAEPHPGSPLLRRVPKSGRTPWPSASAHAAVVAPLRMPVTRTTRASSPCWPAPCASSSPPSSAARSPPASGCGSRWWRCWCASTAATYAPRRS